ncbi:malate:quinone oxidoreductase [Halopseudomonas pachastrellae]|nr:malate:quinone oxidoreductase [Halopseudomonas pachastrellae]
MAAKSKRGHWRVCRRGREDRQDLEINAKFVFLGAGVARCRCCKIQHRRKPVLRRLSRSAANGWFCQDQDVVKRHSSKVYGKAPVGAPPMSVPHLDTRNINGKPALLFGPFAGFTTKFLKKGSVFDLFSSVNPTT